MNIHSYVCTYVHRHNKEAKQQFQVCSSIDFRLGFLRQNLLNDPETHWLS